MAEKFSLLASRASKLMRNESGAVAFEYVLIIGGVSAALIATITLINPTLMDSTVLGACRAIGGVLGNIDSCFN